MDLKEFASEAERALGDRLVALYRFGSRFARGPNARDARLLVLVSAIDAKTLRELRPLARKAHDANLALRFDTPDDLVNGADVFPIFTLEFLDTKELVHGKEVLGDLMVHPEHLRQRIEQTLRGLHRDLMVAFMASDDDPELANELRQAVRRSVYLLRALALVCELDVPETPTVEMLVDKVIGKLLPDADRAIWHRLRRMANFEESVDHDGLVDLYVEAMSAFAALIAAVDKL